MKRIYYILIILTVFACNSENANDCFQTSGSSIQTEVVISDFERILVNRDIELIIKQAPEYKVTIETGENLINDVQVEVLGNQLILTDNNSCNFVRNYGITKIYVEAPNLTEIRTSSQYQISSDGILNYNTLTLFSENFNGGSEFTVGDFRLAVNSETLNVVSNNISSFYLEGTVTDFFAGFYSGSGRLVSVNLVAQNIDVFHRGSNDMLINPQQSLTGELRGAGDVIATSQPSVVDVQQFYTGQLIFLQ